ncbi:LytR C-terminal domain-containing protein [Saccharothrix obliqua]|uniref:LytR C-terminal domain-containing protein n=1 Tax=Saccharothrix obliqua TaxID=2861747 RepID=UPI001C60285F|nr:LytR C-terminal domain-containing protein [Saccharothrix obliqua]MBW4718927.1 LytR C-terminal domain-containing protein [Saccharothrix obliqua]
MSNPEPAGVSHPARAAGIALLGVAGVALVIGVVSLFTNGGESGDAQPVPSSQQQSAGPTSAGQPTGSSTGQPTGTTTAPTSAPTTTPEEPGDAGRTAQPPPAANSESRPPVRVYNNSTIPGLAGRASEDVRRAGWEVTETSNYSQGVIPTTTVYYRPGTAEEQSAQQLAEVLKAEAKPRFDGIESAHEGIILIVTNNYQGSAGKI